MIKIGITGSIASGKTISSKIMSKGRGPLFSADAVVKNLYSKLSFRKVIAKTLGVNQNQNFKKEIKKKKLFLFKKIKNLKNS